MPAAVPKQADICMWAATCTAGLGWSGVGRVLKIVLVAGGKST